jgi:anti-sigma B factor antagonist
VTSEASSAAGASATTIVLTGEIDASNASTIGVQVGDALLGGATAVVVDLSGVTFFDSTGLGALIASRNACGESKVPMSLRAPSPQVRRILDLTATTPLFPLAD